MSRWWARRVEAIGRWTLTHKWEYRILWTSFMSWLVYRQLITDWGQHWLDYLATAVTVVACVAVGYMWWRQDALDEFAERTRAAIGSDANLMILTARLQLRTSTIWRLNRVMRRYDIMNVPALDLPPEAKELREILESVRRT